MCEAVALAAHLLSRLKRVPALDGRDRAACEEIQRKLEEAEKILYGAPDSS